MALKEKIIDKAQKYIQKGYLDKAIVEYKAASDIDPKDVAIRLRLGELYVKINKTNEAIKEYTEVAKANAQRGFYLKAIAVYKQILKLDDNLEVHYKLADLYTKQRLIADAVSEYSFIVSTFEKKGKTNEVLELLKKMIDIDPDNIGIRLRLAELYHHKLSFDKDAMAEYSIIFVKLMELGKLDKAEKVFLGLYNSHPDEPVVLKGLSDLYGRKGDTNQFYKFASGLFRIYRDSDATEAARELSGEILRVMPGDADCLKFMERFNLRGADAPAAADSIQVEEVSGAQPESWTEEKEPQEKQAESTAFLPEEEIEITVEGFEETDSHGIESAVVAFKEEEVETVAPQVGDASIDEHGRGPETGNIEVKEDQTADVSEEAEVEIEIPGVDEPQEGHKVETEEEDQPALQKQAEAPAEEPLVEIEIRSDTEALEPGRAQEPTEEISVEAQTEAATEEEPVQAAEPEIQESVQAQESVEEISVEAQTEAAIEEEPVQAAEPEIQEPVQALESVEEIRAEAEVTIEEEPAQAENIESYSVEEEFSEGSLEEALEEAIEEVNLKISEAEEDKAVAEPVLEPVFEEAGTEVVSNEERLEGPAEVDEPATADESLEAQGENSEAVVEIEVEPAEPEAVPQAEPEQDIPAAVTGSVEEAAVEIDRPALIENISPDDMLLEPEKLKMEESPEAGNGEDYVDLSAELGMEETIQDMAGSWGGTDSKEAYDEFKNGIGQQLSKEDTETHYNLGIAYMEMELYSEASKEFKIALKDPHLEFDCLIRLGLSSMAEGEAREAIGYYLKGLKVEGRSTTERMGMMYELAMAYEAAGDRDESGHLFNSIYDADPGYREVADKVAFAAPRAVVPLIPLDDGLIEVELL